jgi:hypothetical protein
MFSFLKNHPFAVEAFFDSSLVLTFAVPKEQLQSLIPECLFLDTFDDKWAFIAVAMVQTKGLRPKGFPEFMGSDFFLTGYRIFVRYNTVGGRRLRGLYILGSETDKLKMKWMGNFFTHYRYELVDIQQKSEGRISSITAPQSGFSVQVDYTAQDVQLPAASPFPDWAEARKFAGPMPFTFSYNAETKEVLMIEGVRHHWKPAPVQVLSYNIPFVNKLQLQGIELANAFVINQVPYFWKKGKTETWNP